MPDVRPGPRSHEAVAFGSAGGFLEGRRTCAQLKDSPEVDPIPETLVHFGHSWQACREVFRRLFLRQLL